MRYGKIYGKRAAAVVCALSALLLSSFLTACSDESGNTPDLPDEPRLCTVDITLQTTDGMRPVTKAAGDDKNPGTGWEEEEYQYERRMDHWLVVAYDAKGSYAGHTTDEGTPDDSKNDYRIVCRMELPEGQYTFFAFANWESLEKDGTGDFISLIKSSTVTGLEAYAVKVGDIDAKFNHPATDAKKPIPMSSYGHTYTVSASSTEALSVPLIRMIGKVRVKFQNNLQQEVQITDVTIGKFNEDRPIFWVPWKVADNDHYLEFTDPWSDKYEHRGPTFPGESTTPVSTNKEYKLVSGKDNPFTVPSSTNTNEWTTLPSCYVNESMLSSETWTSNMTISITRQYAGGEPTTVVQPTDFAFVRRNDLLEIPVLLSEIGATLSFGEVRLPIGVYPTAFKFGVESGVQILTPITYHVKSAGVLKVGYELNSVSTGSDDWNIRYRPSSSIGGMDYSKISLVSNTSGLLINPETNDKLADGASIDFDDTTSDASKHSGSFTLRTQELGDNATATILLTLIVEYGTDGNKHDIEIPYTIHITNAPQTTSGETTKGGNA